MEWTRELQTESPSYFLKDGQVSFAGVGTVIRARGIVLPVEGLYLREMSFLWKDK